MYFAFIGELNKVGLYFLLAACSAAAITILIERLWTLKKEEKKSDQLLIHLKACLESGNVREICNHCETYKGAMGEIIKSGVLKAKRTSKEIEQAMELQSRIEVAELERFVKLLAVIATIAPLLGLLGTVLGFIQAFGELRVNHFLDITSLQISSALEYALITTALGLSIAIPSILAYHYLVNRIERFVLEMEASACHVVEILMDHQERE